MSQDAEATGTRDAPAAPTAAGPRRHRLVVASEFVVDSLVALPAGVVAALIWANTYPETYYQFAQPLTFVVNEVGLAFFVAIVTKEVVEATLPDGALHPWRRAALPIASALGGVAAAIGVFLLILKYFAEPMLMEAWPMTTAVDIATTYIIARLIFGRHPAVTFLLVLAIASDAAGLAILAVLNPIGDPHLLWGLALMALAIGSAIGLRHERVRSFWAYLIVSGTLSWLGLYTLGVHPVLALVPVVPFMPHAQRDLGLFVDAPAGAHDTLTEFERWWDPPVQVILLLFGLINGGVILHGLEAGTWALPIAVIAGRPIGILLGAGVAVLVGLHMPYRIGWLDLLVIGVIASVGLTIALFLATVAIPTGPLLNQIKVGTLMTAGGGVLALLLAAALRVGRLAKKKS